jgi:hypothetical protein
MDTRTKNGRLGGGRAYRSRLEPFVDYIRQQRQQRKTWKEIAELLRSEKGCDITFQGLHQFYRRYVKRQTRPHWEDKSVLSQSTHPKVIAIKPASNRPTVAAIPAARPFRQPNPENINLNDLTKI